MTSAKKEETGSKAVGIQGAKQEPAASAPKESKPESRAVAAPSVAPTVPAPAPPLIQAANARAALDEALKAKVIEALQQPGANMTKIANECGVSYNAVQSIKAKLNPPTRAGSVGRVGAHKLKGDIEDVQLMKLELEFLRKKVAILESKG